MRIGLYGLPTAGKTFILDAVRNFEFFVKDIDTKFSYDDG